MPTWPSELPLIPLLDGTAFRRGRNTVSSQFDTGPPQVRRRHLGRIDRFRHAYVLTEAQRKRLEAFIEEELADGAVPFAMHDPLNERWVQMQLDPESEIEYAPIGKDRYRVTLDLLVLPPPRT